ncbi:MAG: Cytosolic iron-sulfur protein assembly protein [Trizodia sp. TS-e1964]|nr:MAG: Cytosolic iron-sulfur protein assembly protein [Trizodia sp. TS-e1964]
MASTTIPADPNLDTSPTPPPLHHLADLTPPASSRAWLSAAHPSLPLLATACADKCARIYSLRDFHLHSTIDGAHTRSVRSVAWKPSAPTSPDGIVLATGSFDASAGVYRRYNNNDSEGSDASNADEEAEPDWTFAAVLSGHDSEIKSVAWSAGGSFLATCSRDKSVWVWEDMGNDDWETVAVLQEHEADVKCLAWHPAEELLASASYDETLRLWADDAEDWACVASLVGHEGTVWAVDFEGLRFGEAEGERELDSEAADGPRLVSCSADLSVRVWRRQRPPPRPEHVAAVPGMPSSIRSAAAPSSAQTWLLQATLPLRHTRAVYSVAWSKRSGLLVSSGSDGRIVVYEEVGTEWVVKREVEAAHGVWEVNHVCWAGRWDRGKGSGEEEVVVSTGDDGVVKLWCLD